MRFSGENEKTDDGEIISLDEIDESIDEEELMKNLDADWLKIKEFEKKLKKELGLKNKLQITAKIRK